VISVSAEAEASRATRFHAVIPAAGCGSRMGGSVPKQYLTVAGRTLLEYSAAPLLAHAALDRLVIALAADDEYFAHTTLAEDPRVITVTGGGTRGESVAAGLAVLDGDDDALQVLVHDAARPCLSLRDVERLLAASGREGALLGVPVRDTLKRADAAGRVAATVEREALWQALTPQAFPLAGLRAALQVCAQRVTDEAQAMELAGHAPRLVEGESTNFKVTRPGDLALAAMILARREAGDDP